MLFNFKTNLAQISLPYSLDDCLTDPLLCFGIGCPAIILLIVALIFVWMDYRHRKLMDSQGSVHFSNGERRFLDPTLVPQAKNNRGLQELPLEAAFHQKPNETGG